MPGEANLRKLLAGMRPHLQPGIFVFASLPNGAVLPAGLEPAMTFRESEGMTLVLTENQARDANIAGTFRSRMVTLEIHSSLEAVGFLAAITTRLAVAGIGINPVSAFHHDHLFVPANRAEEVIELLQQLAAEQN